VRKTLLIPFIIVAVFAIVFVVFYKPPRQMEFSQGEYVVVDDGRGAYVDGRDDVHIFVFDYSLQLDLRTCSMTGSRSIYIRFQDTEWRDKDLKSIESPLPSGNYYVYMAASIFPQTKKLRDMEVGEIIEPVVWIHFYEEAMETGSAIRIEESEYLSYLNLSSPQPPPPLYNYGHVKLTRVSENTWIIDVNAWFMYVSKIESTQKYYYVKLSFKLTATI